VSKKTAIRNILLGLLMTSLAAWTITRDLAFGWLGTIFFGSATILFVIKYFKPDFKWVKDTDSNSKEFKEQTEKEFKEIYNDNGIFTFSHNGFSIKTNKGIQTIEWTEIKSMLGYKEDHYAIDSVCLDVFCDNDKSFKITEETLGWFRFLDHSKKVLPTIDKSWEIEISTPAFETNLTVVYDRQNRPLKEVTDEHYKS
jgi:hypothetical protein